MFRIKFSTKRSWAHMTTSPQNEAKGLKRLPCSKYYNVLEREDFHPPWITFLMSQLYFDVGNLWVSLEFCFHFWQEYLILSLIFWVWGQNFSPCLKIYFLISSSARLHFLEQISFWVLVQFFVILQAACYSHRKQKTVCLQLTVSAQTKLIFLVKTYHNFNVNELLVL